MRRGVLTGSVAQAIFITVPIGVPVFLLFTPAVGQFDRIAAFSSSSILLLCLAGFLQFFWGRYFNYKSTEAMGANVAGSVVNLNLIVSLVLAVVFLSETLTMY